MSANHPHQTFMGSPAGSGGDSHLAELVRTLRSLAGDSPERQAKMEGLMRAYAAGSLKVDAEATASAMIDDAMRPRSRR